MKIRKFSVENKDLYLQYDNLPCEVGTKQGSVLVTVPQMPQVFELGAVEELLYVEGVHTKSPCLRRKVLVELIEGGGEVIDRCVVSKHNTHEARAWPPPDCRQHSKGSLDATGDLANVALSTVDLVPGFIRPHLAAVGIWIQHTPRTHKLVARPHHHDIDCGKTVSRCIDQLIHDGFNPANQVDEPSTPFVFHSDLAVPGLHHAGEVGLECVTGARMLGIPLAA